jgi:hypothetical protein
MTPSLVFFPEHASTTAVTALPVIAGAVPWLRSVIPAHQRQTWQYGALPVNPIAFKNIIYSLTEKK